MYPRSDPRRPPFPRSAAILLALAACARPDASPPVEAGARPTRIVALTVGAVDTLQRLGALRRVVAVEEDCFVPGTEGLVKIRNDDHSGPSRALNVEAVLALRPDLVIAKEELRPAFEGRGVEVLWLPLRSDLQAVEANVAAIAERIGDPAAGRALGDRMRADVAAIRAAVAELPRVRVYYEAGRPGRTVGRGTIVDEMISLAGGINVAGDVPLANPVLSSEAVIAADPEVILLSPWSDPPESVATRPGWERISAVRTGRVHRIPERERAIQYPSPGCVDGCREGLVPLLHPGQSLRPRNGD